MSRYNKLLFIFAVLSFIVFSSNVYAQGCANVTFKQLIPNNNGGYDTLDFTLEDLDSGLFLSCDTTQRILLPVRFAPGLPEIENDYYTYERIPYDPPAEFNQGTEIVLPADDCWGKGFSFASAYPSTPGDTAPAFTFRFYDDDYNYIMANSNGGVILLPDATNPVYQNLVSQNLSLTQEPTSSNYVYCPYSTSEPFPDTRQQWGSRPSPVFNSINTPFHDIWFSSSFPNAKMYISFIGEYPCRKCIISYYNVPLYGNTSKIHTSMVVLYETTNVMEFYLKDKPESTSTNGGNAILGIQNNDGSYATTITNNSYAPNGGTPTTKSYNNTVWEAHNEAWRIRPTGNLGTTLTLYKKLSNGPSAGSLQQIPSNSDGTIIAAPTIEEGDTWYYAKMNVTRTDGRTFDVWDSILVHPLDVPEITLSHNSATNNGTIAMNVDSTALYDTICVGDQVRFRFTGGDHYAFVEPAALNNTPIIGDVNGASVVVNQNADADFVFYKFMITNEKDGEIICTRYDSCYIYNRKVQVNIGEDVSICAGESINYKETLQQSTGSYLWQYSSNSNTANIGTADSVTYQPTATGIISLTLTDNRNCTASDEANVTVIPFPIVSIEDQQICLGTEVTLGVNSSDPNVEYIWNTGDNTSSITVKPDQTTTYTVQVSTTTGDCSVTKTGTITVVPIPIIECSADQRICEDETARISVSGDAESYVWRSTDVAVNEGNLTEYDVAPENTTRYVVTGANRVNDNLSCYSSDSLTVYVERRPIPIITYSPDAVEELTPIVVFADSTAGITDRLWSFSDGTTSTDKIHTHTFAIDDSTSYYDVTLTGWTEYGCVDSTSTTISVHRDHHIWAPTGVYLHDYNVANRTFSLKIDALLDFHLKIFNRWGTLVFETEDINEAWDCTYKNENVQQGVYTWVVEYTHKDSPKRVMKKRGTFMIYN